MSRGKDSNFAAVGFAAERAGVYSRSKRHEIICAIKLEGSVDPNKLN